MFVELKRLMQELVLVYVYPYSHHPAHRRLVAQLVVIESHRMCDGEGSIPTQVIRTFLFHNKKSLKRVCKYVLQLKTY